MDKKILCFGEILWDSLPAGLFLGGAPLNVASHLRRLGAEPIVVSAVGDDFLGEESLARIRKQDLAITDIAVVENTRTGVAKAELDADGNANYHFPEPCAWDSILVEPALVLISQLDAIVFGTLAARSEHNEAALEAILEKDGPLKILDVNIRPPHFDRLAVSVLAQKADVIKLNDEELELLSGMEVGEEAPEGPLQMLSTITGCRKICLTRGSAGAIFWDHGKMTLADAPQVDVRDTVGAGDAFTALVALALCNGKSADSFLSQACHLGAIVASHDGAVPYYDPGLFA
ncbi:PfkB family carbohydrate kinase [Rubellicoccus peritrichatus]|uniref:PfkB family carbohydrate kinase n=1 Tax=Rubellicoccus peritrichatus TaxID=3080537 RepID=A0AAQ3L5U2_9BACT|nr:PfkB family carbohydrate kinase [Puniceicoccus sp. CR14]WOO39989.1 PfkB family carbohydrate kinase [Puniceicoccus sp. CR14]